MADFHVWSGGDGSDGLTWATAYNTLEAAYAAEAADSNNFHLAAETFTPGGAPDRIDVTHTITISGGYTVIGPTYETSPRTGMTTLNVATTTGVGSKEIGYILHGGTNKTITISRIIIINSGTTILSSDAGLVAAVWACSNCIFIGNGNNYTYYRKNSAGYTETFTNCTFYNFYSVFYSDYAAPALTASSCIFHTILYASGIFRVYKPAGTPVTYSCFYDVDVVESGTGNINEDPLFNNLSVSDFALKRTSPCILAGDPSVSVAGAAYGGRGCVNIGYTGGTNLQELPNWAIPVGYGQDYGRYYGGHVTNEYMQWNFNSDLSYWTLTINGKDVSFVDYNGTNDATMFTNTEPTTGTAATADASMRFNNTNKRLEFRSGATIKGYINSTGQHYGGP